MAIPPIETLFFFFPSHFNQNKKVELVAEVSIALLDRREVSLIFDEFPMDSIKVKDIKEVIAEGIGKAMDDVYMVRVYVGVQHSTCRSRAAHAECWTCECAVFRCMLYVCALHSMPHFYYSHAFSTGGNCCGGVAYIYMCIAVLFGLGWLYLGRCLFGC